MSIFYRRFQCQLLLSLVLVKGDIFSSGCLSESLKIWNETNNASLALKKLQGSMVCSLFLIFVTLLLNYFSVIISLSFVQINQLLYLSVISFFSKFLNGFSKFSKASLCENILQFSISFKFQKLLSTTFSNSNLHNK